MNTKTEVTKSIVHDLIPQDFNKTFEALKTEIYANYKKNGYGCSDHFKSKQGYEVFYTYVNLCLTGCMMQTY